MISYALYPWPHTVIGSGALSPGIDVPSPQGSSVCFFLGLGNFLLGSFSKAPASPNVPPPKRAILVERDSFLLVLAKVLGKKLIGQD